MAAFIAGHFQARQAKITSSAPETAAIVEGFKSLMVTTQHEIARLKGDLAEVRMEVEKCEEARMDGDRERWELRAEIYKLKEQISEMHAWTQGHRDGSIRTRRSDEGDSSAG